MTGRIPPRRHTRATLAGLLGVSENLIDQAVGRNLLPQPTEYNLPGRPREFYFDVNAVERALGEIVRRYPVKEAA